jgi:pimeloyl-ACP methyl ester carboxylesterase
MSMASHNPTFVLIPGAGGSAFYWHRLVEELERRGRAAVAVDLPAGDETAGLAEYADAVVAAIGDRSPIVLVAQSMGGFTAPLVCDRLGAQGMVMLAAMIPSPRERGADWWGNTGHEQAVRELAEREGRDPDRFDPVEVFLHDLPPDVRDAALKRGEGEQSGTPFESPWPLEEWPDVPTRVLICRQDRFLPAEFQRRVTRDRLGITPDEIDGGHLPALARPKELVARLETYRAEL